MVWLQSGLSWVVCIIEDLLKYIEVNMIKYVHYVEMPWFGLHRLLEPLLGISFVAAPAPYILINIYEKRSKWLKPL
jgi:hypothetical protein